MAILGKIYNEETHTDKVWYDSSNVVYSEFIENDNDNKGQLYVTFKNGSTYLYKDVDMPTDYLMFKNGGIDNSQGKTLNKQIKGKYEFEKVEDKDINLLLEELNYINKDIEENKNSIVWKEIYAMLENIKVLMKEKELKKGLDNIDENDIFEIHNTILIESSNYISKLES